jgi:DNA-binding beta-propeller fold protein YncE
MKAIMIGALSALIFIAVGFGQAQEDGSSYKVLRKIELGGEGTWDYLTIDAEARRLYITRSSHVMVMDIDKEKLVGDIPNTPGVHGVALALKHRRGFTSNGGDSTVTVFDLETLKPAMPPVKVGTGPDAILYDSATDRVFTFNATSKDATALDAATGKVAGTVKLGGRPEFAAADGKGTVYVNLEDTNELVAFDSRQLTVRHRSPLSPGATPTGLAIDPANHRLFSTCRNEKMVIVDSQGGKVVFTVPIGKGTDACIYDPDARLAFSSNRDGTLTVVDAPADGKYRVLANVPTQYGAKTMALDPKTHNFYLATAQFKEAAAGKKAAPVPNTFVIVVVGK